MSTLTWLDTSEADRRQALDIIDAFRDRDTRDELGLGSIRDGLSNILFPGTTTIQTRARYFLFIPWIYRSLENARVSSSQIAGRARAAELALIPALKREGGGGIVGVNAGADLKRLPSGVYWQGLGSWGVRQYPGSQDQYHRSLDAYYRRTSEARRDDDGEFSDAPGANWDPGLPDPPADFPAAASLRFRQRERDYLRDSVVLGHPDTFLAFLIQREPWDPVPFAWDSPWADLAPATNRHQLHHARCFSELMHGAQLLYNLLLAEALPNPELIEAYRERLDIWRDLVEARGHELTVWAQSEVGEFWSLLQAARISARTKEFVEGVLARILAVGPAGIADDEVMRDLVARREAFLKRKLARLTNRTSLTNWGGAAGAAQLDVRWGITQALLLDILMPVETDA